MVAVAGDLFSVYRQTLELLQVQWHPHQPGTLCLLTSDDTLRVFSLANPNVPLLTFPLSAPTPLHGCALDDSVVAFSLLSTAIFILRDTGDVHLSSLSPDAPCSPPLVMHPPAEDNYGSDASRILALPTSPSTLIIANSSGTLHHCVYIHEEMQVYNSIGLIPRPNGGLGMRPEQLYYVLYAVMIFAVAIATRGGGREVWFSDAICGRECPVRPDVQ